jgi:hypothetical protein
MNLKDPLVAQDEGSVTVTLRHEPLATPEEIIIEFLHKHGRIRNKQAREVCFIGSENKMKRIFQRMMNQGLIERVPGTTRYTAEYQLKEPWLCPGGSITNSAEVIAAGVIRANELPTPLVWIEHWPEETTEGKETFELVIFSSYEVVERAPYLGETRAWIGDATWKRMDRATVEALVGTTV